MKFSSSEPNEIRTDPCISCHLCGTHGERIYTGLRDRLFGAPGLWTLMKCRNTHCGVCWLNPMPVAADIGKAYSYYYTHNQGGSAQPGGAFRQFYFRLKANYFASHYGYCRDDMTRPQRLPLPGQLLKIFPLRRAEADYEVRYLSALPGGELLDVGCGSGDWMASMSARGWKTTGVDFDADAVDVARQRGLEVHCGALEDQRFSEARFDAVTLNQVIEHVPDPLGTLRECARVLKPEGRLIVSTPNVESLSHRVFKQNWRGLEPPRHLHIFTLHALRNAIHAAGLHRVRILPLVSSSLLHESYLLSRGRNGSMGDASQSGISWMAARGLATAEMALVKWRPSLADILTAIAIK